VRHPRTTFLSTRPLVRRNLLSYVGRFQGNLAPTHQGRVRNDLASRITEGTDGSEGTEDLFSGFIFFSVSVIQMCWRNGHCAVQGGEKVDGAFQGVEGGV
jgi:hypothetical protein